MLRNYPSRYLYCERAFSFYVMLPKWKEKFQKCELICCFCATWYDLVVSMNDETKAILLGFRSTFTLRHQKHLRNLYLIFGCRNSSVRFWTWCSFSWLFTCYWLSSVSLMILMVVIWWMALLRWKYSALPWKMGSIFHYRISRKKDKKKYNHVFNDDTTSNQDNTVRAKSIWLWSSIVCSFNISLKLHWTWLVAGGLKQKVIVNLLVRCKSGNLFFPHNWKTLWFWWQYLHKRNYA